MEESQLERVSKSLVYCCQIWADMDSMSHNNQAALLDLYSGEQWNLNIERIVVDYTYKDGIRMLAASDGSSPWLPYRCEIRCNNGEHWLYPATNMSPYPVPCLINDSDIIGPCRLTHGSTVQLGRSLFRFSHPASARRRWKRLHHTNNGIMSNRDSGLGTSIEDASGLAYNEDCDLDMVDQFASPDKIANLASSYVCHQLLLYTDRSVSAQLVDQLFKALQEQPYYSDVLSRFILRYNKASQSSIDAEVTLPAHEPVIRLLIELLKFSLDPVGHNILWLQLLEMFCHFSQNLCMMVEYEAAATIMGTMAAHRACPEIQTYACQVLAWLANYRCLPYDKLSMKECTVELVVEALRTHGWELSVLVPACRVLANLTASLTDRAHTILTKACASGCLKGSSMGETQSLIMQVLSLLDTLRERALPYVRARVRRFPKDMDLQTDGRRMGAYFSAPNVLLSPDVPISPKPHRHASHGVMKRNLQCSDDSNLIRNTGKKGLFNDGSSSRSSLASSSGSESCDSCDSSDDDDWI